MHMSISSMTHVGRKREHNEDAFFTDPETGIAVVCDGLGGLAAGEVASRLACDSVRTFFKENADRLKHCASVTSVFACADIRALLREAAQLAHENIRVAASQSRERQGMACTIVMMVPLGNHVAFAHAGDSRAYLHRRGRLYGLTRDHNYAIEAVHSGSTSLQELMHSDKGARLTRCLGCPVPEVEIDVLVMEPMNGDTFLLCSDGVTTHMSAEDIQEMMDSERPEHVPEAMVAECNACGGVDNITAVVAQVTGLTPEEDKALASRIISFRSMPIFSRLGLVELTRIFNLCTKHEYPVDEVIIHEGDDDHRLFICLSGHAEVRKQGAKLASIRPNDVFGEMALLENMPRSADVVADKPMTVLIFEREDFIAIMREEPWMAIKMLFPMVQHLNHRLRHTNAKLAKFAAPVEMGKSDPNAAAMHLVDLEAANAQLLMTEDELQAFETALYGSSGSK